MSERDEEVPELDAEAKAFLTRHQQTGEPSAEALERAGQRLSGPAPVPNAAPGAVVRLAPRRRPLVPPEAMAAAAVVILLLGAQVLYLALREPVLSEQPATAAADAELKAVSEAWRAGEFVKAGRLAKQSCSSPACGPLAQDVAKMIGLAQSVETLSDDERDQLATFDRKISDGRDSALKRKLESRNLPVQPVVNAPPALPQEVPEEALPPSTSLGVNGLPQLSDEKLAAAKRLFDEAADQKRTKNYERAIVRLAKCIQTTPSYHPCYRLMGSVYASIAVRDQSAADMEHARKSYERFLEVAPPDDEYVPKVRAILDAAKKDGRDEAPRRNDEPEKLALVVGGSMTVTLTRDIARVAVGDPATADISVAGPRALRIEGKRAGTTTILVWYADSGRVSMTVVVSASNNAEDRVDQLLVDASMARASNDYPTAFKHLRTLQQLEPDNEAAIRMLAEIRAAAKETYLRAYQLGESNPEKAMLMFKQVMEMTLPSDDLHQKAENRVATMQR